MPSASAPSASPSPAPLETLAADRDASLATDVRALGPIARAAAATLQAIAAAYLLLAAARVGHDLVAGAEPVPPLHLARDLAIVSLAPYLLAHLIRALARAELRAGPTDLVVRRGAVRWEIPWASIAAVEPWRLPLPGPGLSLRLASGRRFRLGLATDDPGALIDRLGRLRDRGPVSDRISPVAVNAVLPPILRWARARAVHRHRAIGLVLKFVLFPLAPTFVLFRAHQYIAFGGLLGEYHLAGAMPWLRTLGVYWVATTAHLVLWAALWRTLAELIALGAALAWRAPARALTARRAVEILCAVAWWIGVPVLVALRFLD